MGGYALGSRQSLSLQKSGVIEEVGAILTEADFKSLYAEVTPATLTDAQLTLINSQIVDSGATITNADVKLLQTWYHAGTNSNKIFANKLIAASLTTYAEFGTLYSK